MAVLRAVGRPTVRVGQPLRLDAAGSRDASGVISLYRWDWGGTEQTISQTIGPHVTHVFTTPGNVLIGLEVVDDHGLIAHADLRVTVLAASKRRMQVHSIGPRSRRAATRTAVARTAENASVTIKDFSFGPSTTTVHVGDSVTWVNEGPSVHTATAAGVFDTGILKSGQSASHTFTRAGTFSYICSVHPFMKATVTVLAASGPSGSSTTPSESSKTPPESSTTPSESSKSPTTAESTSPSTTSTSEAASEASSAKSTPTLPNTGANMLPQVVAGLALLMLGLLLRRRTTAGRRGS